MIASVFFYRIDGQLTILTTYHHRKDIKRWKSKIRLTLQTGKT